MPRRASAPPPAGTVYRARRRGPARLRRSETRPLGNRLPETPRRPRRIREDRCAENAPDTETPLAGTPQPPAAESFARSTDPRPRPSLLVRRSLLVVESRPPWSRGSPVAYPAARAPTRDRDAHGHIAGRPIRRPPGRRERPRTDWRHPWPGARHRPNRAAHSLRPAHRYGRRPEDPARQHAGQRV